MKSSKERMRKDEMQLTISLIPLAIESNRPFPSEEKRMISPDAEDQLISSILAAS